MMPIKPKGSIKEFYNGKEKYLFIGNGVNLLSAGLSWPTLLQRISASAKVKIGFNDKTYPLIVEEIAFKMKKTSHIDTNIKSLKEIIGKECNRLSPNKFHKSIVNLKCYNHFLTTNYDYCIESAILQDCDIENSKNKKNPKYSLNRYNLIGNKKVWHIHGEIDNGLRGSKISKQESIMIGNEHYGDYQKRIHDLVKGKKGLYHLMKTEAENWIHVFFSRDIDIIGFGMDFTEAHLWLILNFRARMKRKGVSIANNISFYYPSFEKGRMQSKIDLLSVLDVVTIEIPSPKDDYETFYKKFIISKSK